MKMALSYCYDIIDYWTKVTKAKQETIRPKQLGYNIDTVSAEFELIQIKHEQIKQILNKLNKI